MGRNKTPRLTGFALPINHHPSTINHMPHLETLAVHAGRQPDATTGAVSPGLVTSTTFERGADGSFPEGFTYTRADNPNRRSLETALAALEGGAVAMAFSSGQAATAALLQTLSAGDHVLLGEDL